MWKSDINKLHLKEGEHEFYLRYNNVSYYGGTYTNKALPVKFILEGGKNYEIQPQESNGRVKYNLVELD